MRKCDYTMSFAKRATLGKNFTVKKCGVEMRLQNLDNVWAFFGSHALGKSLQRNL